MSSSLAFVIVIVAAAEGGGHFQGMHPNPHPGNLEKKKHNEKTILLKILFSNFTLFSVSSLKYYLNFLFLITLLSAWGRVYTEINKKI